MVNVIAKIVAGYQIASGKNPNSLYLAGSIGMQIPVFQQWGLDLSHCYKGTLNCSITPKQFQIKQADYCFEQIKWHANTQAETFSFVEVQLYYQQQDYAVWLYYPHPESKPDHFHRPDIMEILAPFIPGIGYGQDVTLYFNKQKVAFLNSKGG